MIMSLEKKKFKPRKILSHKIKLYCLCFNMVSFRGQKRLGPRPDQSPLGV